jgi:spore germination protein KA
MNKLLNFVLSLIIYSDKNNKVFTIPEFNKKSHYYTCSKNMYKKVFVRKSKKLKEIIKPTPIRENKNLNSKVKKATDETISNNISLNIEYIKRKFNFPINKDIVIREFTIFSKYNAFIAYLDGMVDRVTINNSILRPLLKKENIGDDSKKINLDYVLKNIIETNQTVKLSSPTMMISEILTGNTCLYIDGCDYYISSETKGFEKRSVGKPLIEGTVNGSQEAFNENLRTNITLLRKIIKNNNLTTEFVNIGERNNNQCAIVYLNGFTNPAIVEEVKRRITKIKTDYISGNGMLEQFIEENSWSILPTILSTERPDRTASHLMEGKVAIISEGTPFSLVVPITFFTLFHSPEDSSVRWQYGTLMRFIRVFAIFLATLLPGLYIALTNFHQEMIPTDLLLAIAKARENVPFPTILEVIFMEFAFELIHEAGIRIPGIIGNTIGIIGGLILGQAAVQANIVSPILIIIIAITGLGNFSIIDFSVTFGVRFLRLFFIFLGAFIGFYGITIGIVSVTVIMANMKSFGVDMLAPIAPIAKKSTDLFVKRPVWNQENRPDYVNAADSRRQPKISRKWINTTSNNSKGGHNIEQ